MVWQTVYATTKKHNAKYPQPRSSMHDTTILREARIKISGATALAGVPRCRKSTVAAPGEQSRKDVTKERCNRREAWPGAKRGIRIRTMRDQSQATNANTQLNYSDVAPQSLHMPRASGAVGLTGAALQLLRRLHCEHCEIQARLPTAAAEAAAPADDAAPADVLVHAQLAHVSRCTCGGNASKVKSCAYFSAASALC